MAAPTHPFLQRINLLNKTLPGFPGQLDAILREPEYEGYVHQRDDENKLSMDDLMWLISYLDDAVEVLDPSSAASRKCLRELRTICGNNMILPPSHIIPLDHLDDNPFAEGGFGDVYRGTFNGSAVCVKRLRIASQREVPKALKMFCQEAVMWKYLKHPNILPLLGTTINPAQLVSRLMPSGNLSKYIDQNPEADKLKLLSDVAKGVQYLHSRNVIHGDLKGINVLMDVDGDGIPRACVADFGTAIVTKNLNSIRAASRQSIHTPLWSAPEILKGDNPNDSRGINLSLLLSRVVTGFRGMGSYEEGRRGRKMSSSTHKSGLHR